MDNSKQAAGATYLEQSEPPPPPALYWGSERVTLERMAGEAYLALCRRLGEPRVGQALRRGERAPPSAAEFQALLAGDLRHIYVLREAEGNALGLCEFDRSAFPQIELTNFGIVPQAQGRGLGPWLLATALQGEWRLNPDRIWLRTAASGDAALLEVYERAGFRAFAARDQPAKPR